MINTAAGLVLVDTSAWICFFAKTGYLDIKTCLTRLLDENRVAITGPIVLELLQGCRSEAETEKLEARFRGLHWLPLEDRHWYEAGRLAFALRRVGITVGAIDALIATISEANHTPLLQRDSDFARIAQHTKLLLLDPGDNSDASHRAE
jgi:predicted nucleic acid-binding protein